MARLVGKAPRVAVLAVVFATAAAPRVRAEAEPAVFRGIEFLRAKAASQRVGESALTGLALIKAEVSQDDPTLAACVAKVRGRLALGGYRPDRTGGHEIYEAAVAGMLLANVEAETRRNELNTLAQYLISRQNPNGSWDYSGRTQGDSSISQYAVLGLWELENSGATINPGVWDRAAQWYLSTQLPDGGWKYHPDAATPVENLSMTAAGAGSLLICKRQLARYRRGADAPSPLLATLAPDGKTNTYEVKTPFARIDHSVQGALAWLAANFTTTDLGRIGHSAYYMLYGIERIVALADPAALGRFDWLGLGRRYILASQRGDGAWPADLGDDVNTVWAIFFLTRSTAKTLRRIQVSRLGAGTLLGGRGLPRDLSSMTVAAGKVVSRPMNGAVEGMLAVLEDPRAQAADSALAGLVSRYEARGPEVLRPHKDRFRKLLTDRDPGLRRVAAWALGHTDDLDAAPGLIGALTDPDEEVVAAAQTGLRLISRKIEGPGPPSPSTPEQRREAARLWRAWYQSIRPIDDDGRDDLDAPAPPRSPR